MNELLKMAGVAGGAAFMILCCVAPFVVFGAIGWMWAWLGGIDPVLAASVALLVAVLAYGLIRGRKRAAGACEEGANDARPGDRAGLRS